jgi:hypothetical protein
MISINHQQESADYDEDSDFPIKLQFFTEKLLHNSPIGEMSRVPVWNE